MQVNVKIPVLSAEYEFEIDENKQIASIIEEIVASVCQQEHLIQKGSASQLLMFHQESKRILQAYQNPVRAGVKNGDTLIIT